MFDRIPIIGGVAWTQRTRLSAPALAAGDSFGQTVSISGNWVAVGAPNADVSPNPNAGRIYVYESAGNLPGLPGNTFTFRQTLLDPLPRPNHQFGLAVALDGTQLVAGTPSAVVTGLGRVSRTTLFRRQASNTWTEIQSSVSRDPGADEHFGAAVAISGEWLFVGAPQDMNNSGDFGGAAYALNLWASGPIGEVYCVAAINSTGQAATIEGLGSPFLASNSLSLRSSLLPPNQTGFFLVSRTTGFVPTPGGSRGNLCLGGAIGRFIGPGQVLNSGPTGAIELAINLLALPLPSGNTAAQPGDTLRFQAWYRYIVPNGPTSNFSPGLAVVIHCACSAASR